MVNFREFLTSSGLRVLCGKSAESNDSLVYSADDKDTLLHTAEPGSPFVNLGSDFSKRDLKEAAVFCARYSQDWRDFKRDVIVNVFLRKDMKKDKKMKAGSWIVSKQEKIRVKKADVLGFEEDCC